MDGFFAAKLATQIVSGLGVSKIVGDIVRNNVAIVTPVQAVTVRVGSFVLGSMLWEQSANHIETQANQVRAWYKQKKDENDSKE